MLDQASQSQKIVVGVVGGLAASFALYKVGRWLVKKITPATPLLFMDYMDGTRKSGIIKAAIDLKVFTHVYDLEKSGQCATVAALAHLCSASEKGVRILMDALAVAGFVEKHTPSSTHPATWYYTNTKSTNKFLVEHSPDFLGCMTNFILREEMIRPYYNLANNVKRGGQPFDQSTMTVDNDVWVEFAYSLAPLMKIVAPKIANLILSQQGATKPIKVLDISASHGLYGLAFATKNPNAQIVAVDWANVLKVAEENAKKFGVADRFSTLVGDANQMETFGTNYDVALVPNFLHHFDAETNTKLLKKIYECLNPGGKLVIVEFIANELRTGPANSIMFGVTMLSSTEKGDAFTVSELSTMATNAGFKNPKHHSFFLIPSQLVVAEKI